eukprot:TRINITY_DN223_c0_g1_i1.p1 TRINITY_DN223_c0_g1~~TRINITY_DN223_c0_g1_i1.p1  ORF type:complete len:239 (-),score=46.95 TRINITY_DN223_c0_g1_i1:35-751(-)
MNLNNSDVATIEESKIRSLDDDQLYLLVEKINDTRKLQQIMQIRFLNEFKLKNDDLENPFILWKSMNRDPKPWVAFILAKIIVSKFEIHPNDIILTIPSSGTWIEPQLMKLLPECIYPKLVKITEDFDKYEHTFNVPSHSNDRKLKTMAYLSNCEEIKGKNVFIVDDVLARGDAMAYVSNYVMDVLGGNVVGGAVVMSKSMQFDHQNDLDFECVKVLDVVAVDRDRQGLCVLNLKDFY